MVSGERSNVRGNVGLVDQLDRPRPPAGSNLHSGLANETGIGVVGVRDGKHKGGGRLRVEVLLTLVEVVVMFFVLGERLADSLLVEDESDDRANSRQRRGAREKDARSSDSRGQHLLSQRARMYKRQMMCPQGHRCS
ncbi:Poly(A) RNA polymerase cid11 [Spatholobus suberectus]|nr:Poly(A) RNA polymerase cid11 [Spatholobus suberectus]